jgi:hypothetical protein
MALCRACGGSGKNRGQRRMLTVCKTCKGTGRGEEVVGSTYVPGPRLAEDPTPVFRPWYDEPRREREPDLLDLLGQPEYTEGEEEDG